MNLCIYSFIHALIHSFILFARVAGDCDVVLMRKEWGSGGQGTGTPLCCSIAVDLGQVV